MPLHQSTLIAPWGIPVKLAAAGNGTVAVLVLACCASAVPQFSVPAGSPVPASGVPTATLTVPEGENLVLELKSPLNTKTTRKGDRANFLTTTEVVVGDQVAIPRGTTVRATVTEAKRAGVIGKSKLDLKFDEIVLAGGAAQPLSAEISRAAFSRPQGDGHKGKVVRGVASNAASAAIIGVIFGGTNGAIRGAAAGAAIGAIGAMARRGPELDFPPGMMFEIELTKPLNVPVKPPPQIATNNSPAQAPEFPSQTEGAKSQAPPAIEPAGPSPAASASPASASSPADHTTVAASRTISTPSITSPVPPPPVTPALAVPAGGFKLKVDVDLIVVDATVRDERGAIVDHLKRDSFHLYEDRVEQQISHFSRDELPLAIAVVVDRSGSMGPVINELRHAAYDTLSQLKPEDEVALFSFAATPERMEYLTTDRQRIADDIAAIHAGGGTNIADALWDAALYLGRAAPGRRHAVVLVSDNDNTMPGHAGDGDVIRTALETETVIYSIKVGGRDISQVLSLPLPRPGGVSVPKIAHQTGGEVIDANGLGSVQSAMATVIARLKQRYSLGYYSTNARRDGAFRQIEIRVIDSSSPRIKYSIYARRGYYARMEHTSSQNAQH